MTKRSEKEVMQAFKEWKTCIEKDDFSGAYAVLTGTVYRWRFEKRTKFNTLCSIYTRSNHCE